MPSIKNHNKLLVIVLNILGLSLILSPVVMAAPPPYGCPGGPIGPGAPSSCPYTLQQVNQYCADPSGIPSGESLFCPTGNGVQEVDSTSQPVGPNGSYRNFEAPCKGDTLDQNSCGIIAYLVLFIRILSGLVGVVVVMMIIIGGIQYSTARGNPQAVAAARQRILNAVLALVTFLFAFAFLQWLVPGGVL